MPKKTKKAKAKKPNKYEEKIAFPELEGKNFDEAFDMIMHVERPKPKKKTKDKPKK